MNISRSIRKLTLLFIVLFVGLSGGLVYWQVAVAQAVVNNPHNIRSCLASNTPIRGRIFDRNGVLLADSRRDPKADSSCGYVRHYYYPALAGLIGYYPGPNYLATGIEKEFNNYLMGQVGMTALDNIVNHTLHRPPVGDDIYLTIDVRIQNIIQKHFDDDNPVLYVGDVQEDYPSKNGSVVVSDPHTGEILGMYSSPGYDPNRLVQELSQGDQTYYEELLHRADNPLIFRPLQAQYVPGSVFKTVTLLGALDSGVTRLTDTFTRDQAKGPVRLPGVGHALGPDENLPASTTFPVSVEHTYVDSDNVAFGQIGYKMGVDSWLNYTDRFYVNKDVPFDLPVQKSTVVNPGVTLDQNLLVDNAFGQGQDFVTPFQMMLINNIAANGGQLMQPMLISKITTQEKSPTPIVTNVAKTLGDRQVSADAAAGVRQAMYGVIQCGSGAFSNLPLDTNQYSIIGKTGTGEVGGGQFAQSWMITQAPYDIGNPSKLPQLTIVGMREHGGEGAFGVGPMISDDYNDIFALLKTPQVPPQYGYCAKTHLFP